MGLYLEHRAPPHMTKLDWLEANGTEVAGVTRHSPHGPDERVLVATAKSTCTPTLRNGSRP